jgi:hypothetical protein
MKFKKSSRDKISLKLAITGISGRGKSTAALRVARGLVGDTGTIGAIDTENGSLSLYSDITTFDTLEIPRPYEAGKFIAALRAAQEARFDCVIIDSASHIWESVLSHKEQLDKRGGNSFANWADSGKLWQEALALMLSMPCHVIACLRCKTEYVIEQNDKGKSAPRKVGLAPIARDGTEYEFSVVWDLASNHVAGCSKDRTRLFDGRFIELDESTGRQLRTWLDGGTEQATVVETPIPTTEQPTQSGNRETIENVLDWLWEYEDIVNPYLKKIKWINENESYKNLIEENILKIAQKPDRFAMAAGIPVKNQ